MPENDDLVKLVKEIKEAKDIVRSILLGCLIAVFILVIITTFFGGS